MENRSQDQILSEKLQAIRELVQDVPEIKRIVTEHAERLDSIEATLAFHSDILRGHSDILRGHSDILRGHSDILRGQSADLAEIKGILGGHREAIVELSAASHTH